MRLAACSALVVAAALVPGAAASRGGIGLSASPLRLALETGSSRTVTVRNPGRRALVVSVSRAGFALSLRGRPRVRRDRSDARWLKVRQRRLRIGPGRSARLRIGAAKLRALGPGDHPALVLLTTRPLGSKQVRVRLRIGVIVVLHVPGRIVRRLEPRAVTVERRSGARVLELRLLNRGNVTERLDGRRLRIALLRDGHRVATLRPLRRELLPHSAGIVEFVYHGSVRGAVAAEVEVLGPRGRPRSFRVSL